MYSPPSNSKRTSSQRDKITLAVVSVPAAALSVASIILNFSDSKRVVLEVGAAAIAADLAVLVVAVYFWMKQFRLDLKPMK
jgi:hypothetical protein